jgi:nucleoside-diphosphate-sugar epimerase
MKILVIGGRGFIGPYVVKQLLQLGHEVAIFNRGKTNAEEFPNITHIKGDFEQLDEYIEHFKRFSPEVVLHMLAMNERVAKKTMDVFEGIAKRIVVPSSMDVYRAYGIIRNEEPHDEVIQTPMNETAPLRTKYFPHGGETEKILVEQTIMNNPNLPGTILRLPMVYGPGDSYRIFNYLKRMIDRRPYILIDGKRAKWRGTRGYVENVAVGIVSAIVNEKSANRKYNVGEEKALSEHEMIEEIAEAYGWDGKIKHVNKEEIHQDIKECLPLHIIAGNNYNQDWVTDTTLIRDELNYKEIVPFKEAIRKTVLWNKDNPPPNHHKDFNPNEADYEFEDRVFKDFCC